MKKKKMMTLTFKRRIPASPAAVYEAWLSPKSPCNPWHEADAINFKPKVGGLYYFRQTHGKVQYPHYGRFLKLQKGKQVKMIWVSNMTAGTESELQVDFVKKGADTVLTLKHSKLHDDEGGWAHDDGWKYYLDQLVDLYAAT